QAPCTSTTEPRRKAEGWAAAEPVNEAAPAPPAARKVRLSISSPSLSASRLTHKGPVGRSKYDADVLLIMLARSRGPRSPVRRVGWPSLCARHHVDARKCP